MLLQKLKVLRSHGKQYIEDLDHYTAPASFPGRPAIEPGMDGELCEAIACMCPSGAFAASGPSIDLGRCLFCRECSRMSGGSIVFTNDYRLGSNVRSNLIVTPGSGDEIVFDSAAVRDDICRKYGRALKLREVSAGGDASNEMELNASMNVNFDFGRYGVEFVASPRHADGIVVTGPITANMAEALEICYCSVAEPKMIIMAGCDAIFGGIFAPSPALDRSFLERYEPDLWLPGNPVHPMTFIEGVRTLLRHGKRFRE